MEVHLGHAGRPCPSNALFGDSGSDWEDHGELDEDGEPEGESEWEDEEPYNKKTSSESILPDLKGRSVVLVVDCSGLHRIRMHPCYCSGAPDLDIQCLRMGLFPTSFKEVKTVITFQALEDERLSNLECKTPVLRYWNKLCRKTSSDGWQMLPVSKGSTLCMV